MALFPSAFSCAKIESAPFLVRVFVLSVYGLVAMTWSARVSSKKICPIWLTAPVPIVNVLHKRRVRGQI